MDRSKIWRILLMYYCSTFFQSSALISSRVRQTIEICPQFCTCSLKTVNCDGSKELQKIPQNTKFLIIFKAPEKLNFTKLLHDLKNLEKISIRTGDLRTIPILPDIPSLKKLDLSGNKIRYVQENSLILNRNLEEINLSKNFFQFIPEIFFKSFKNLKILDLSGNKYLKVPKTFFRYAKNLEMINLSGTKLYAILPSWQNDLQNLIDLNVSHNSLKNLNLVKLRKLRNLDASYNPLRAFPRLQYLRNLKKLSVSHTFLSSIKSSEIKGCENLVSLDLSFSKMTNLRGNTFKGCHKLEILDLGSSHDLWIIENEAFLGLKNLRILNISHCPNLHELENNVFNNVISLVELDLHNSDLKVFPYSLKNLLNLRKLNLKDTSILCDCHAHWFTDLIPILSNLTPREDNTKMHCTDGSDRTINEIANHIENLNCTVVKILSETDKWIIADWGNDAVLQCNATGKPGPKVIWQTMSMELHVENKHIDKKWLNNRIYEGMRDAKDDGNKYEVLNTGELIVRNVTRSEIGRYKCFAYNSVSNSSSVTFLGLSDNQFRWLIIQSVLFGGACAATFLLITLAVQLFMFITVRLGFLCRCCCCHSRIINRAKQVKQMMESIESYKTDHLERLRETYNNQMSGIKNGCYDQVQRLREGYSQQVGYVRDICDYGTQQITSARDQYIEQVNKIRDYSFCQMNKVRENYLFQRNRIRKYSGHQLLKLRETYKYQQKALGKMLENLPDLYVQSCRATGCPETDSMDIDRELKDFEMYYKVDYMDLNSIDSYYTPENSMPKLPIKHCSRKESFATTCTGSTDNQEYIWITPRQSVNYLPKLHNTNLKGGQQDKVKCHKRSVSINAPRKLKELSKFHKRSLSSSSRVENFNQNRVYINISEGDKNTYQKQPENEKTSSYGKQEENGSLSVPKDFMHPHLKDKEEISQSRRPSYNAPSTVYEIE